jgi:hypothetical protein
MIGKITTSVLFGMGTNEATLINKNIEMFFVAIVGIGLFILVVFLWKSIKDDEKRNQR